MEVQPRCQACSFIHYYLSVFFQLMKPTRLPPETEQAGVKYCYQGGAW